MILTPFGPGDPITWGRPTGHPLDPRTAWDSDNEPNDEADAYCPLTCTDCIQHECHRYNQALETDPYGPLRCRPCLNTLHHI